MTTDSTDSKDDISLFDEAIQRLLTQQDLINVELKKLSESFEAFKQRTERIRNSDQADGDPS